MITMAIGYILVEMLLENLFEAAIVLSWRSY